MEAKDRLIVALDGLENKQQALALATILKGRVGYFKVNDLLVGPDPISIEELSKRGLVFADYKFYDIPNTVFNEVQKVSKTGAGIVTVHASGGIEMMRRAVQAAKDLPLKVFAVTVLTSFDEDSCHLLFGQPIKAKVLQLARDASIAGVYGIVCSGLELQYLSKFPELAGLKKIVPGIRPLWHQDKGDQKRVMTPGEAIKAGADYLVIGRPITEAEDQEEAAQLTVREISQAIIDKGM